MTRAPADAVRGYGQADFLAEALKPAWDERGHGARGVCLIAHSIGAGVAMMIGQGAGLAADRSRGLRRRVSTLPSADLRFKLAFEGAEDDGEGVTSTMRDAADEALVVRSRFLVEADGARSAVRELIGAAMSGA